MQAPDQQREGEWDPVNGVWKNLKAVGGEDIPDPLWVFGYGSLCFSPGSIKFEEFRDGHIKGFTRRFWQQSCDHRGTPEKPGLVCTLLSTEEWELFADSYASGLVYGRAYRIAKENAQSVLDELDFREKGGYSKITVDVHMADEVDPSRFYQVKALLYTGNTKNPNFLGDEEIRQSIDRQADIISASVGPSGNNRDYLYKFHKYLADVGKEDTYIADLVAATEVRYANQNNKKE